MDLEVEEFLFERAINTFLLLVWCSTPQYRSTISVTAGSVALFIASSEVKTGLFSLKTNLKDLSRMKTGRLKSLEDYQARFAEEWFEKFFYKFFGSIGGLRVATGAASFRGIDSARRTLMTESKRELAIVDFLAKALSYKPELATRSNCEAAFEHDVLGHGQLFYRPIGAKQVATAADPARSSMVHKGLKKTKFGNLWDECPDSIVALYVFRDLLSADREKLFSDRRILIRLDEDSNLQSKMQLCLRRYETIMRGLEGGKREIRQFKNWRFMTISQPAPTRSLPKFSAEQQAQVEKTFPRPSEKK